jgi:superfamily I DNA/RNA helicase/RecB family exonuclease
LIPDQDRGRWLVTGPPGTGKTEALRERFATLVSRGADPERIALFVLTRRASREGRERIAARLRRSLPALPIFTAHGYAFGLVRRRAAELGYDDEPLVLSAADQYTSVRELLAGEDPKAWPRFGHLLGVAGFAREVADFILRAQERLLAPEDLPSDVEVVAFYRRYKEVQALSGRTDFAGLLDQAVALLQANVGDEDRFDHILVDDYQDATLALDAIVAALAPDSSSVTIAADPGGHVFSYRGGSIEPLARIQTTLPGLEKIELNETHRAGVAAARLFAHPGEEADAVAHELLTARVDEDVPWDRMAVVLRRYGSSLSPLRQALSRHGIPHIVVGEAAAIAVEPAVAPILDLIRYALLPERRDDLVEPVLGSAAGGLDPHQLRQVRREARIRGLSIRALAESGAEGLPADINLAVQRLRDFVALITEHAAGDPAALFFELWSRFPSSARLVAEERHRDLDALAALGDILHRFVASRPNATIGEWLSTIEAAEFGPDPWVAPEERHPSAVRVTTAHRAHGSSYDVVCIAGCVEGEFPSAAPSARLVDIDRLTGPTTPQIRLAAHLAEEGRLFRLAASRARKRTVLFASHSTSSTRPLTQSRYAKLLGVEWSEAAHGAPTSLRGIEAGLRRRIADTTMPPPSRLAAVAAAAEAGLNAKAWWGGRAWTDPGAPLYSEEILTSYSRLSTLENCGLQYLYQVEMGLDPESTHSMWVGVLIHDIIDRAQRGVIPRTLDGVLTALDEGWDPDVFPSRAIESRRYQDCRAMLKRWIDGEKAEVVHSEVSFKYPLDGALIRGKIDAIFRMENGHLRIVDYKTGRYAPAQKGIDQNLQLAAYFLATVYDEELRKLGETGYMQLAFPAKEAWDGPGYTVRGTNVKPGYQEWAEGQLKELLARIRAENFAPSPEADCKWCDFKIICPLWPEGSDAGVQR